MGNFRRDNRQGGRRDFGGSDFRDRGPRQMYDAICSNCGRNCQVPFRPTGDKPVFCDDCFAKRSGGSGQRGFGDRPQRRANFENRPQNNQQFDAINAKLDKILRLLNPETVKETPKPEPKAKTEPIEEVKEAKKEPGVVVKEEKATEPPKAKAKAKKATAKKKSSKSKKTSEE
jgi:CxxC-x17-CxxC domain-containing protein